MSRSNLSLAWDANRVLHAPLLQRFVDLRLGEGCVGPKRHFLAQLLLPLNLRQQQFFLVVGTADVARAQLGGQTITLPIEQQQGNQRVWSPNWAKNPKWLL